MKSDRFDDVELDADDCMIVIRPDGSVEAHVPDGTEREATHGEVIATAILMMLADEGLVQSYINKLRIEAMNRPS